MKGEMTFNLKKLKQCCNQMFDMYLSVSWLKKTVNKFTKIK